MEKDLKEGVINGYIPSDAYYTACTYNDVMIGNASIQTGQPSTKVFTGVDSNLIPGSTTKKIHHPVQEPTRTVYIVPTLADQYLLIGNKSAKAGYVSIYNDAEVNIYDGRNVKIVVSEAAVLKGWQCPQTRMWRVTLHPNVTNLNKDTLLVNSATVTESLNSAYTVPSSERTLGHIMTCCKYRPDLVGAINNVYNLSIIKPVIR